MNNNMNTTNVNSEKETNEQENSNNVEKLLNKIKNLPIANDEKAVLMKQLKTNIMTPSKDEDKNLEEIKNKYLQNVPQQMLDPNYSNEQMNTNLQLQPQHLQSQQQYNPQQLLHSQSQQQPQPHYLQQQPTNLMTTAHFEILKNKLDSLQYELIDLLRHVKDYTQRYMNAVRQQDLDKIDDYINGLFEVDKALKETREKSKQEESVSEEDTEKAEDTEQSMIAKTTNGITSFMGNIGSSVSGITGLVSSTADMANNYLSKKIISSPEETSKNPTETLSNNTKYKNTSSNKNVMSINDYINDKKENKLNETNSNEINSNETNSNETNSNETNSNETNSNETNSNETNSNENQVILNSGNINKLGLNNTTEEPNTTEETTPENLGNALEELNNEMENDINNTLLNQNDTIPNDTNIQSGGSKKSYLKLKNNIEILNLKLTKKKLQKRLNISNKKVNKKKLTKHKLKKNKKNTKRKI